MDGKQLSEWREQIRSAAKKTKKEILVCGGPGCLASGANKIYEALQQKMKDRDLDVEVALRTKKTGCHGMCERGPLVVIEPAKTFYPKVTEAKLDEIIEASIVGDGVAEKLLFKPRVPHDSPKPGKKTRFGDPIPTYEGIDFYRHQKRLALRNCGTIDPDSIEDYVARDGYNALATALAMKPDEVIAAVEKSGLRGRGGGGFPAGRKWRSCVAAAEKREKAGEADVPRYVLGNGDEGDPGAFMDRVIMEGDPHSVVEGITIAAYAVGAREGFIYVREEYPLAVERLGRAIVTAKDKGLLGEGILGTDFSFELKISRGGGAFVCGESSALMQSVAGNVGEPRAKYVRSVERGLYDEPTVLNNVETLNCVSSIIANGAETFAGIGTAKSTGTKAFSLAGTVRYTGLIEVPMGVSLRHIIYDLGGGVLNERAFKAAQTGGPSGGCLPADCLDLAVDFDTLTEAGSMMGSGGMVIMDDLTCMVDVARYFTKFLMDESCGKCVPCREGLVQMHEVLTRICEGKGKLEDLDQIEALSYVLEQGSLCALGTSAANPVKSTLQYFRDEYIEHIEKKRCRAGVCRDLTRFDINDECNGCLVCLRLCPMEAISGAKQEKHLIDQDKCDHCGVCIRSCKFDAIDVA